MTIEIRERGEDPSQEPRISVGQEIFDTTRSHIKNGIELFEHERIVVSPGENQIKFDYSKLVAEDGNYTDDAFFQSKDIALEGNDINHAPELGRLSGLSFTYVPEE